MKNILIFLNNIPLKPHIDIKRKNIYYEYLFMLRIYDSIMIIGMNACITDVLHDNSNILHINY